MLGSIRRRSMAICSNYELRRSPKSLTGFWLGMRGVLDRGQSPRRANVHVAAEASSGSTAAFTRARMPALMFSGSVPHAASSCRKPVVSAGIGDPFARPFAEAGFCSLFGLALPFSDVPSRWRRQRLDG